MATPKPSEERPMWIRTIFGWLLILVGGVWFAQGINVLGGSSMTGNSTWAVIGFPPGVDEHAADGDATLGKSLLSLIKCCLHE